jgi:microcystin-dependent protein
VGTIIWRASNNAPAGKWTECTGVAVLRIGTFGNLFAEIGTIWGIGNGSTTFNLPKMNGRSPIGAGLTDFQSTRQVGQYFGNENATLTIPNMPSHQHGGATTGIDRTLQHSHAALIGNGGIHGHSTDTFSATNTATAGGGVQRIITGGTGAITINPGGDHNHSVVIGSIDRELDHLHYVQYEGSGTPFNIINPINVMKCYIKY